MGEIKIDTEATFLDIKQRKMELSGFWDEQSKHTLMRAMESYFNKDVIREWQIGDIIIHGDRALVRWDKRFIPLTDERLNEIYGH